MAIKVTAKFTAKNEAAAAEINTLLAATKEGKYTQEGLAFTVVDEYPDVESVKAYAESEAFQALKAKSEEIIEGGFAGIVIDKAEV